MGKFEIKRAVNRQFYFNLLAGNGQIILQSEMYKSKASAIKGIESIKNLALEAMTVDLTKPKKVS